MYIARKDAPHPVNAIVALDPHVQVLVSQNLSKRTYYSTYRYSHVLTIAAADIFRDSTCASLIIRRKQGGTNGLSELGKCNQYCCK